MKALLVSGETLVRQALAVVLTACLDGAEVTQAGGAKDAAEVLRHGPHDVALVDIGTAEGDCAELLRAIHSARPDLPVVILSASDDPEAVGAALGAGAAGYVLKDAGPKDLATAVWMARSGSGNMISARAARNLSLTEDFGRRRVAPDLAQSAGLTRREVEVLEILAEGATNRQISRRLFLSEKTVKAHLASAFRRLGVQNRTQAAMAAAAMGIAGLSPGRGERGAGYQPAPA